MTDIREPLYGPAADQLRDQLREPTDLHVAIGVAQKILARYGDSRATGFSYPAAFGATHEALRLLLRALDAEAVDAR
jgi:hypothetical protein